MDEQLSYLKAVIEGADGIEPWAAWFERNAQTLAARLSRGEFLRLKLNRIGAIPEVLSKFGITYHVSDRYAWLGGVPGLCRDCGAEVQHRAARTWCPRGCFTAHVLRR